MTAKAAQLRLVDSYKAIRYKEDAADACATLRKTYPDDAEVKVTCEGIVTPTVLAPAPATNAPPATTGPPATSTPPATPSAS